jgi:hypothetical protein
MSFALSIAVLFSVGQANAATPDSNIATTYALVKGPSIRWMTCGSIPGGIDGCFGIGTLSDATRPCSITAGAQTVVTNTPSQYVVSNPVYVLDGQATAGTKITLYIYTQTNTITASSEQTTFTLKSTVSLPVVGGPNAVCSMAANGAVLVAGTDHDPHLVRVNLKTLQKFEFGPTSPPTNVTAITQDQNKNISIQYGTGNSVGYILLDSAGSLSVDGGGVAFLVNPGETVSLDGQTFVDPLVAKKPTIAAGFKTQ